MIVFNTLQVTPKNSVIFRIKSLIEENNRSSYGVFFMRLFTAAMATETNAFCPIPTAFEDFKYGIGEASSLGDYFKVFSYSC